jgi:hypothetical protein
MVVVRALLYDRGVRIPFAILVFVLVGVFAPTAVAQQESEAGGPSRIVVSPLVYVRPDAVEQLGIAEAREAARAGVRRYVARAGRDFDLVSISDVEHRIQSAPSYSDLVRLADDWAEIGLAKYQELDAAGAVDDLREAYGRYREAHYELVAPKKVAEVLMFLALASLERGGDVAGPLQQMKEMIVLDPGRVVRRGAFPEEVVQFYESARLTFEREIRQQGPAEHPDEALARAADADVVLSASVLPDPDGSVEVVVWRWEASEQRHTGSESIRVTSPDPDRIAAAANRLASRHLAVLTRPPPDVDTGELEASAGLSPFSLDINFAYASYLQFPDVTLETGEREEVVPFGNVGAALGAGFRLTREFALVTSFQFLSSMRDYDGVTQGGFTTLRWFGGGEIGGDIGRLRAAIAATAEVSAVGSIVLCTDKSLGRRNCTSTRTLDAQILAGVNVRPRLGFRIIDPLMFWVAAGSTFYFVPFAENGMNFLTAVESGLTYRF